jgi:hypothetical protein
MVANVELLTTMTAAGMTSDIRSILLPELIIFFFVVEALSAAMATPFLFRIPTMAVIFSTH